MTGDATACEPRTGPRVGALVRRLAIRVVNISSVGCLLESTLPVEEGTVALLALHIGGRRCVDAVRITRVVRLAGGVWAYRLGAELLALTPPNGATLRRVALLEGAELAHAEARTTSAAKETAGGRTAGGPVAAADAGLHASD